MRHREGRISVLRRVQQSHVYELRTGWPEVRGGPPHDVSYIRCLLCFGTECGHGPKVGTLQVCGAVQAHSKERRVQFSFVSRFSGSHVVCRDLLTVRNRPNGVAELLDEVWVSTCDIYRLVEGVATEGDPFVYGRR